MQTQLFLTNPAAHPVRDGNERLATYRGAFCSPSALGKIHVICGRKNVKKCPHAGERITLGTCAACKYRNRAALQRLVVGE